MATPTLSIFTGSENLGTVFKEQNQINVKYFEANLPLTATTGRLSLRMTATRFIMIQGATDGTGFTGADYEEKIIKYVIEKKKELGIAGKKVNILNGFINPVINERLDSSWGPTIPMFGILVIDTGEIRLFSAKFIFKEI